MIEIRESSMYLKDYMASDKDAVVLEFWDASKGKWQAFEARRTSPGIAVTRKNKTVRFHENMLTDSERQLAVNSAIENQRERAEKYNTTTATPETATKNKTAKAKAASSTSERDFALHIMNKFGLNADEAIGIMSLCKARYATATKEENKVDEVEAKLKKAGLV